MTDHLTPADFAAVPWGGRAIPPEEGTHLTAVRVPDGEDDGLPWLDQDGVYYSDDQMAEAGWTLPAPADPWEALSPNLRDAWDTGEVRDGEDEPFVVQCDDGNFILGWSRGAMIASPYRRFRPRPRPSWQDAEVVEASTEGNGIRRLFHRDANGKNWWCKGGFWVASELLDPVPMTVQKKEER